MKFICFLSILVLHSQTHGFDAGFEQSLTHFNILNETLNLKDAFDFENVEDILQLFSETTNIENNFCEWKLQEKLIQKLEKIRTKAVNRVVDVILKIVGRVIIKAGFDPLKLDNQRLELPPRGTIKLSDGSLQDISTIHRYADVNIKFNRDRKLTVNFPISFKSVKFSYNYLTRVLLTSVRGKVLGEIENLSINVELGYDFGTKWASLEEVDMSNTGSITVKFEGNDRIDWISNEMTSVINTVVHPVIVKVVENLVTVVLEAVVDQINQRVINSVPLIV